MKIELRKGFFVCVLSFLISTNVSAAEKEPTREEILEMRMDYYIKYSSEMLPWYYLAAIDQYERNLQEVRSDLPKREGVVAFQFSDDFWVGLLNPIRDDRNSTSITFFDGSGLDGNNDGFADLNHDDDVMFTLTNYLSERVVTEEDFEKTLKDYYTRDEAVKQIMTNAEIYKHYNTVDLDGRAFPLALQHNYSYRSTWGDRRG
ncbi:MAG: peptidase M23, partial [Psychrobacillus psychrotolerans]